MKIVLDTNILISSLLNPNGIPAKILNLILSQKIILLFDNRILNEYYNVLRRDKFQFSDELILPLMDFIKHEGIYINTEPLQQKFTDEDDKMFYEVFISGSADYLVTGNINHFPKEKLIVKPAGFVDLIIK